MKISNLLGKLSVFGGLASTAVMAHAGNVESSDYFYEYYNTINQWATGGLGVGLATTMLVMGGAIGVAKNSPMPTLTGVAGAAFLHFGPSIIRNIMLNGYSF
jgi:conjugal transfer pilus assembly protein TraA